MPFVSEDSQSERYNKLGRRQIVIWSFLIFMMVATTLVLFYISYQVMKGNDPGGALTAENTPVITPVSKGGAGAKPSPDDHYFLYGRFSAEDGKYHIYKMFYRTFEEEELFSFVWHDPASQPSFAQYGRTIAAFPDVNKGFFISPEGKMILSPKDFIPPDAHFSISPDNKWMFYFTYLSSIGTTSLTLRDLEKDKDVMKLPVSSAASHVCDFQGWSQNGAVAYCLEKNKGAMTLRSFNALTHATNVVAAKKGITDGAYYPKQQLLLAVADGIIYLFDQKTGAWPEIARADPGIFFENALLTPDGSGVLYTQRGTNDGAVGRKIYFIFPDGSGKREVVPGGGARLVSVAPDSQTMLMENFDKKEEFIERYSVARIGDASKADMYLSGAPVSGTQFIGWSR